MSNLLILTVGTGTSGRESNLAQGLVNTLRLVQPRLFWLVPSASPESVGIAELVKDGAPADCRLEPWSKTSLFRHIPEPDDLYVCRAVLREAIQAARTHLQAGETLLLNPTSGTKQMSVAATLAALDEEIGEVIFTVGERLEGVVRTGTEAIKTFSTRQFFAERAVREARRLAESGAYDGAGKILEPYRDVEPAARLGEIARCLHAWQRLDFKAARQIATGSLAPALVAARRRLETLALAPGESLCVLAELLFSADECRRWGAPEDALARYYRALEMAAKIRLAEGHNIRPPYQRETLADAARGRWSPGSSPDEIATLGLSQCILLLATLDDEFAHDYRHAPRLRWLAGKRNDTMIAHGVGVVTPAEVEEMAGLLSGLLAAHFQTLAEERRLASQRPRLVP